jgi:hypothetical protein
MRNKRFLKTCTVALCLVQLAISTGCALGQGEGSPISKLFVPAYTPIIMVSEGTKLPSKATLVSIDDLVAQPQKYADQFIEVRGFNAGGFAIPACSPYFGPIDHWGLLATPYTAGYEPPMIEVKGFYGDMVNDWSVMKGGIMYNTMMKKAAVWGWWKLYEGPIGCWPTDFQGTSTPNRQSWYLDAVKLQWLESIKVPTPTK